MELPSNPNADNTETPGPSAKGIPANRRAFLKAGLKGAALLTYVTPLIQTVSLAEAQSGNSSQGSPSVIGNAPPPPPALPPRIDSLQPDEGNQDQTLNVSVQGRYFEDGIEVEIDDKDVKVKSVAFLSSYELLIQVEIKNQATPGSCSVRVTNPDGQEDIKYSAFKVKEKEKSQKSQKSQK